MALLHFLVSQGWKKLVVAHFDHGLRGAESDQDASFARELASSLEVDYCEQKEDIAKLASEGRQSLETVARVRRDAFFQTVSASTKTPFVFLAHHLEDNAETILGNLCRGSALAGVSGMELSACFESGLIKLRPLLPVFRQEVDEYIAAHALVYREDSSNQSTAHRRNRLRHEVLPLLNSVFQRDVSPILTKFGKLAARDEDLLQQLARGYLASHPPLDDGSLAATASLRIQHPALLSRILKEWLVEVLGLSHISYREIEAAMTLLTPGVKAKVNLPGSIWLRRKAGRLFVEGK